MMAVAAAISAVVLLGVVCGGSPPIPLKDLASKIQISKQSTPDELASAAVAWSLADMPTDQVCDYAQSAAPSYTILRAATSAKCVNIKVDIPGPPKTPKDVYDAILAKPEPGYLDPLLTMGVGAPQHEKLMLVHAGSFLLWSNADLQGTSESKQIVAWFYQLAKSSSKDLLRFGDEAMSHLQKANHLGSSAYYLGTLDHAKPEPELIQRLAEMIVSESYSRSTEDIAAILELTTALSRYSKYSPVICDTVNNKDGLLSLKITDLLGKSVETESVRISSCKSPQGSISPIEQLVSDGVYNFKFDLKSANAGLYHPIVKIMSQGREIIYDSPKMALTAFGGVELSQFKAWTSSKHEESISSITANYPNESKDTLEITSPSTHLHVSFQLNTKLDDVAYIGVALINVDTQKHVILTPTKQASGRYKLKLKYTHSTFATRVPGNGRYQIKLLVSDPKIPDLIAWTVCDATINLAKLPGAVRLVSDFVHKKQPEISHVFRQSESRCHPILSFLFTAFVATPLIVLIPTWKSIGLCISIPGMWGFLFHTYLSAILVVLTVYWAKMTLFHLGTWLIVLAPFTLIVGNRALRSRRDSIKSKED